METKVITYLGLVLALMYSLPADAGVYIRWGRTTCHAGSIALYTGNIAAEDASVLGGGVNYLCLSDSPSWGNISPSAKGDYSPIEGVQYWTAGYSNGNPFSYVNNNNQEIHRQPASCVACQAPNADVIMIPAQSSCPSDMVTEYTGYIVANHYANYKSEYICLDEAPEVAKTGGNTLPGGLMILAQINCGMLACPHPYVQYNQISCSVCSI